DLYGIHPPIFRIGCPGRQLSAHIAKVTAISMHLVHSIPLYALSHRISLIHQGLALIVLMRWQSSSLNSVIPLSLSLEGTMRSQTY
ncbi:MAG: hypothetical protein WCD18_27955, partial [Thermosynechococcaceae cyanobacterium]